MKHLLMTVSTAAILAASLPAIAQPQPSAVGVPHVGTSAGPYCNSVIVGGVQFVVPNAASNAVALLLDLSAAEARGQSVSIYTPADLGIGPADAQCQALLNGIGTLLPQIGSYK